MQIIGNAVLAVSVGLMTGSAPPPAQEQPAPGNAPDCAALAQAPLPSDRIGLPTRGARVSEARLVADAGKRAYCLIKGQIAPIDPAAPPVLFEVNLPAGWNGKFVQYGGGGLNGTLVTGLDPLRDALPGPTPLEQGYATGGTDGGHPAGAEVQRFALNDEALTNHAFGAYKKTHDVAIELIRRAYARAPRRVYFFGASEGGREAMSGAQRYPDDYDGIVSVVPILSWTGVNLYSYQLLLDHQAGGYMSPEKVKLWEQTDLAACDGNDGLRDGVVADYRRCDAAAAFARLRCPSGDDRPGCFSSAQLTLIDRARSPYRYGLTLAHGEAEIAPYGLGGEATPRNVIPTIVDAPGQRSDAVGRPRYTSGDIRFFVFRDQDQFGPIDLVRYGDRIRQVSALMDMNDPDLTRFARHGGKMIVKSNTADYLVTPGSIWRYYENVLKRLGKATADNTVRLYISPGTGHFGGGIGSDGQPLPDRIDLLAALDRWVEIGRPMQDPVLTAFGKNTQPTATWPLCRYPDYPRYAGRGNPKSAASYRCVPTTR